MTWKAGVVMTLMAAMFYIAAELLEPGSRASKSPELYTAAILFVMGLFSFVIDKIYTFKPAPKKKEEKKAEPKIVSCITEADAVKLIAAMGQDAFENYNGVFLEVTNSVNKEIYFKNKAQILADKSRKLFFNTIK